MSGLDNTQSAEAKVEYLTLDEIRIDGGTQPRVSIDWKHVKLLEGQIEEGHVLEPVTIFYDGESYWLADGFHRWYAHYSKKEEVIACAIHNGSLRDAIFYSVGANAHNKPALPRSREDKRRSILTLLLDTEWNKLSNYQIADVCRVNEKTVRNIRSSLTTDFRSETTLKNPIAEIRGENLTRIYRTKHGTTAKMNVANIGKSRTKEASQHQNPQQIAHHLTLVSGGLVEINAPNNSRIHGRLGRIGTVSDRTVSVWVRDVERMTMHSYSLEHQQVEAVAIEKEPQLLEVCARIYRLKQCNLHPFELEILNLLERPVAFTPVELKYLAQIESYHGIDGR